ncbi:MAG: tetratricopeptide repeat protein [Acidobacteria bacterium]|nr:tetratricopeptide repeat protein [Acidobacteriota bacterium]
MTSSVLLSLVLAVFSVLQKVDRSEAGRWFGQARRHFERQEWDQSRSAALRALQADPQFADAEILVGLIASAQAHLPEAEQHLKRAIALQPSNPQAHSYLAGVYLQQKRLAEAERGYREVLKLSADNPVALYNLGLIALLRDQPALALENLESVRRKNPKDVPALMGLLETRLILKRNTDALQSAAMLEAILDSADPRLFQMATLIAVHKEYSSAITILERLNKNLPGSFEVPYNLALAYVQTGQNDQAARVLRSVPSLDQRAEGLNLLGQVEQKRNRPEEALEAFSLAAALQPRNEQFRFEYANQLLQAGKDEKAAEAFGQGCLDFSQSWKMRAGLGACQYLSGQYERAAQSLFEAVRIEPNSSTTFFLLGKLYPLAVDSQEWIREAFSRYLDHPRTDAWAYFNFGSILFLHAQSQTQSDLEPAIRNLRRALELSPQFPEASLQLGMVFQTQGKLDESVRLLEQVVASAPDLALARYRLAQTYQRLGAKEKARVELAAYEKLKAQSKSNEEIHSILQTVGR